MKQSSDLAPSQIHRAKYLGAILAGFGLISLIVSFIFNTGNWFEITEAEFNHYGKWIIAAGLFFMAFSKEKTEDERVQQIRFKIMKMTLQLLFTIFLIFNLSAINKPDFAIYYSLETLIFSLIFYHLLYHFALIYNPAWAFSDTLAKNFKPISPKYYLGFIIIQLVGLIVLLLLNN